jgi:capsule biosynthesis phosphatase
MKYIILCGGIQKTTSLPNPLNYVNGRHLIEYIIEHIPSNEVYIFYNIFLEEYNFEEIVVNLFKEKTIHFVKIDYLTRGPAETAYIGAQTFTNDEPIVFIDNDNVHNIPKNMDNKNFIGYGNNKDETHYSFIKIENALVTQIEEKVKISDNYCSGIYGFKSTSIFLQYCQQTLTQNKFYFSQIYQLMLEDDVPIVPIYIQYTKLIGDQNNLLVKPLRICFDLDNTLVTNPTVPNDYSTVKPIPKMIQLLQYLKQNGHEIIIHTARRMKTHKSNVGKVIKDIALVTIQTLEKFNIEYDELIFGKPIADIYIDDKALNPYMNDISYYGIETENVEFIHNKVSNNKFNLIKKHDKLVKKTGPYSILKGELYYYQNIPPSLADYFPVLHNFNKYNHSLELSIDHIQGIPLFFLYKNRLITPAILCDLFSILKHFHSMDGTIQIQAENIHNNYFKKLRDRFTPNDYSFEDARDVFNAVLAELERTWNPVITSMIHGDFWFSNIILDYHNQYKVIDMKGQVDGILTLNGDMYYDYGKLYQSILGYDLVLNDCSVDWAYLSSMREIFIGLCTSVGLDIDYLTAVTRSLMFGTIYFIEDHATKQRIWEFIKQSLPLPNS